MAAWLIGADHVGSIGEIGLLILWLSFALFVAAVLWLAYVAISRSCAGIGPTRSFHRRSFTTAASNLVASHVLAGVAAGCVFERIALLGMQILVSTPVTAPQLNAGSFGLSGPSHNVASILANGQLWLGVGLLLLVPAVLLRLLTRRLWAADLLGAVIFWSSLVGCSFWEPKGVK